MSRFLTPCLLLILSDAFGVSVIAQQSKVTWSTSSDPHLFFDKQLDAALCHAIQRQDFQTALRCIRNGADVNARGKYGVTPLYWSLPVDNAVFDLLLNEGADPNVWCSFEFPGAPLTATASATFQVANYGSARSLKMVLEHNGDPNAQRILSLGHPLGVCLTAAIKSRRDSIEKVKLLIEAGVDLDYAGGLTTPLAVACSVGRFESAEILLCHGANPNLYDSDGLLPCHYVADHLRRHPAMSGLALVKRLESRLEERGALRLNRASEVNEYNRLRYSVGRKDLALRYAASLHWPEVFEFFAGLTR